VKSWIIKSFLPRSLLLSILILPLTGLPLRAQKEVAMSDSLSKAFYDSLRVKAEKRRITSLLYDMIVVTRAPKGTARENMASTAFYDEYEGRTIRTRKVIRLNAFGTDLDNPDNYEPSGTEKLINSTYTKTKRFVINQYLLFRAGDTISSLQMADNERLLRQLPYIDDALITIMPVDSNFADVTIILREKYPYGADVRLTDIDKGRVRVYDRNFAGLGHELGLSVPYDFSEYPYPGIGIEYSVKNIAHSFSDLVLKFSDGLGSTSVGGEFSRRFVTSETRYAWSASLKFTRTTEDLDTMIVPAPLNFVWQDYWGARSIMLERQSVTRLIISGRYVRNNVFKRPKIEDNSYYRLQNYQLVTGSFAISSQRFINTSLIYSYGRTEDIPYGYLMEFTGGVEKNEFKSRIYSGISLAWGNIFTRAGYIYSGLTLSAFNYNGAVEQGELQASLKYFTPLINAGRSRIRTFVNISYTRGINRYSDELLYLKDDDLVRGFSNDSISGSSRLVASVEPVVFIHKPVIGFRFAIFAFADAGLLINEGILQGGYYLIPALGAGVRIRNDQLVLNTLQIRLAWYPRMPPYSVAPWINAAGIMKLNPPDFEPKPPGMIPFE
jgi:hypothetical protein